jgi:hypothetical protein
MLTITVYETFELVLCKTEAHCHLYNGMFPLENLELYIFEKAEVDIPWQV